MMLGGAALPSAGTLRPITPAQEFDLSAGCLCLDFANTVSRRPLDPPLERLHGFADLVTWSRLAGLLDAAEAEVLLAEAARRPAEAEAVHVRAIALREAIFRIVSATASGQVPAEVDVATLNDELRRALAHVRLVPSAGRFEWGWEPDERALDRLLWPIARSAAEVLTGADVDNLRVCEGRTCRWLFLDTTRNHSRRWCDMKTCGNRAKVRRHYERRKGVGAQARR